MPSLEKIRLTNVSYNNGHNIIADEILDLNSASTLMKLMNGGGKSVMTQLLISPFVSRPALRTFKERKFTDYFKSANPSWVIMEWLLEDKRTRIVTGMAVRKISSVGKDGIEDDNRIDFKAFIGEYEADDDIPYSLENLPLVETASGRRSYMSGTKSGTFLNGLVKQYPASFSVYNMNDSAARHAFSNRLSGYNIQSSEWDQMRSFNLDESGLSAFGERYPTEDKLIREQLLPAIEKKLDEVSSVSKTSLMDTLKDSVRAFLQLMINNQDTIAQKKDRTRFAEFLERESAKTGLLAEYAADQEHLYEELVSFLKGLSEAQGNCEEQEEEQQDLLEQEKEKLEQIDLEIYSAKYWEKADARASAQQASLQLLDQIEQNKTERDHNEEILHAMRLGEVYSNLQANSRKKAELTTRIDALKLSNADIQNKIDALGGALKTQYEKRIAYEQQETDTFKKHLDTLTQEESALESDFEQTSDSLSKSRQTQAGLQTMLEGYQKQEKVFSKKYSTPIQHSLSMYEDQPLMEQLQQEQNQQLAALHNEMQLEEQSLEQTKTRLEKLEKARASLEMKQNNLINTQKNYAQEKAAKDQILEQRKELLMRLDLDLDDQWNIPVIERYFQNEQTAFTLKIQDSLQRQNELKKEREQLETGCSLDLSDAIKQLMKDLDIQQVSGVDWLRKSKIHPNKKDKLIREFPFLPYSLIMSAKERTAFFRGLQEQQLYTSVPIPVLERDALNHPAKEDLQNLSVSFYLHFNKQLVQPGKLDELLKKNRSALAAEVELHKQLLQRQSQLLSLHEKADLSLTSKIYEQLLAQIEKNQKDLDQTAMDLQSNAAEQAKTKETIRKKEIKIRQLQKKNTETSKRLDAFDELFEAYKEAAENYQKLLSVQKQIEDLLALQSQQRSALQNKRSQISQADKALYDQKTRLDTIQKMALKYAGYKACDTTQPIDELEPAMEALLKEQDFARLAEFQADLEDTLKKIDGYTRSLKSMEASYGLSQSDYEHYNPGTTEILDQEDKIKLLNKTIESLEKKNNATEKKMVALQSTMDHILEDIQRLNPALHVLDKSQISSADLNERKTETRQKIEETQKQIDKLVRRISDLEGLMHETQLQIPLSMDLDPIQADLSLAEMSTGELRQKLRQWMGRRDSSSAKINDLSKKIRIEMEREMQNYPDGHAGSVENSTKSLVQDILSDLIALLDQPKKMHDVLLQKLQILHNILEQLEADLKNLEENKEQTAQLLDKYVSDVHRHMGIIDRDTTVQVHGKSLKLFQISQPSYEKNEELYKSRMREYLDELANKVLSRKDEMDKLIPLYLSITSMYDYVVGIKNVDIKVYKIEAEREEKIPWSQAGRTSGAEGFLCSFSVVAAMLNYRRQNPNRLTGEKQASVMIMDNPFAKSQSKHIIDTFMSLSRQMRIQVVAFTAIDNAVILNAFDNIYNLRLNRHLDQKYYIEGDHIKNKESSNLEPFHIEVKEIETQA